MKMPIKRGLDIVASLLLLAFTFPLMCLAALAIRCESAGPVFEKHPCIGRNGHCFNVLSFRTTRLDTVQPWADPETKGGYFVRVTRIDILPQLVNVIRGQMSLFDADVRSPSFLE